MNLKHKRTNKKDYTSGNRGITLIALVITIIVMLILVAVTISMALNGGLFSYAGRAARETEIEINKERDLANVESGLSADELIEKFTGVEKEWTIAWVYKNNAWSNPYFKDKTLENSFNFAGSNNRCSWNINEDYSISSENELTGQIVAKLYNNGELIISGSGPIPYVGDGEPYSPWRGAYHTIETLDIDNQQYMYYSESCPDFTNYLNAHISSVVIGDGITSIPGGEFYMSQAETFSFPSTISDIAKTAFEQSRWILNISNKVSSDEVYTSMYPDVEGTSYWCIDVEINGETYTLALYVND